MSAKQVNDSYALELNGLVNSGSLADIWRLNIKMLFEFANNSLINYEVNKKKLAKSNLKFEITFDLENLRIEFSDNAGGTPKFEDYMKLFVGDELHIGAKLALFWFGKAYIITTNSVDAKSGFVTHTTHDDIVNKNTVAIRELPYIADKFFTRVEINNLNRQTNILKMTDGDAALIAASFQQKYPQARTIIKFINLDGKVFVFDYKL